LAIVAEIAGLFEATMSIESGTDQVGTKINILFPAANDSSRATPDPE
jgi:hypothetical protein